MWTRILGGALAVFVVAVIVFAILESRERGVNSPDNMPVMQDSVDVTTVPDSILVSIVE